MKSPSLDYYVWKLKAGDKFSLARFGDGEFLSLWGKEGENSNGCKYSPELKQGLVNTLKIKATNFIHGMQRVLPKDQERAEREYPNVDWHDTEIFSEAVAGGRAFPLIEQLKKMKVMIIGNFSIREVTKEILPNRLFLEVTPTNSYDYRKRVTEAVIWNNRFNHDYVYIFCCGMGAKPMIGYLHEVRIDGWLLDLGHFFDPFIGSMSRCDLEGKTQEDIEKNLHASIT